MNLRGVLMSVQNLLVNPEKLDPQDQIVGQQAIRDEYMFMRTAREWTKVYAGGMYLTWFLTITYEQHFNDQLYYRY